MTLYKKYNLNHLIFLFFLFANSTTNGQTKSKLSYELSMPEPEMHFFEVRMNVNGIMSNSNILDKDHLIIKMPVWTPGSYLVREFSGHVQGFQASNEKGKLLKSRKINKNTWEIEIDHSEDIQIAYKVYAYELTVRTSFIDMSHGYANGASVFMFIPELMNDSSELTIYPYKDWSTISTALSEVSKNKFIVKDFDTLVDSPIEIGNHEVLEFEWSGIPYKIAMYSSSPLKYDKEKLLADYKKLVSAAETVVGESPIDHYLFIIHHQPGIGGGLEHLYSTTCHTSPNVYENETSYKEFFSLLAHEYFHLWNVKRIRPVALGPFDYENENYTHMLWVAEGFTKFYEKLILRRAGLFIDEDVLKNLTNAVNYAVNSTGAQVQSVTESSWDAWVKYYRPNENSANSTISYYTKGGMLASLLSAKIIANTKGDKTLDDVMRLLYQKYYKDLGRGYTDEEFQQACEDVHGSDLDYFFENYVSGTKSPDYTEIFKGVGIDLIDKNKDVSKHYVGITERGNTVFRMSSDGSAYHSGLNTGDYILSIDNQKGQNFADAVSKKKVGDKIQVSIARNNVQFDFEFELKKDERKAYELQKMKKLKPEQEKLYQKFLGM